MTLPETVKVVFLGESDVGKYRIISQFINGPFGPDTAGSLSSQFLSKTMEFKDINKSIKFDIWDTAGQERFRSLAKIFYKDAKVICLCYDITSKKSFDELKEYWYEQAKINAEGDPIYAVVECKNELYEYAQVKEEEAKEFSKSINGIFQTISALKNNNSIDALFEKIERRYFFPNP